MGERKEPGPSVQLACLGSILVPWFSLQTLGQCLSPTLAMRPSQIGEGLLGLKGALSVTS